MKYTKYILLFVLAILFSFAGIEVFFHFLPSFWKTWDKFCGDQSKNTTYIYVIGESTAFGEPYSPKISFPEIVKYMFNGKVNNKAITIINLAKGGTPLESQYWKLFTELSARPRLNNVIFIYAGINDFTNVGYGNDKGDLFSRILCRSIVFSKLAFIERGWATCSCEYNLERVIRLAQSYGLKVVISNLVGNFTEFAPKENQIFVSKDNRVLLEKADEYISKGELDRAKKVCEELINLHPNANLAHVYYRLGKIYRRKGEYDFARKYYYMAADTGDKRPTHAENEVIKRAAIDHKTGFVDTLSTFENNSKNGLIGYDLCGDAHHPNLKGYIILAKGFARELGKIYAVEPERTGLSEEEITEYFKLDDTDMFRVYMHNLTWHLAEASSDVYRKESIERAKYCLQEAVKNYELNPSDSKKTEIELSSLMIAAVSRDLKGTIYWLKKGEFLTKKRDILDTRSDFFYQWLYNTLCELALPDDILREVKAGKKEDKGSKKEDYLDYVIVK